MQAIDKSSAKNHSYSCEKYQVERPSKLRVKENGTVLDYPVAVRLGPGKNQLYIIEYDEAKRKASQNHVESKDDHQIGSISNIKDEDSNV